jgi:hypothetical protein
LNSYEWQNLQKWSLYIFFVKKFALHFSVLCKFLVKGTRSEAKIFTTSRTFCFIHSLKRTPPNKVENLPPLTFHFQYASKIELEILHIFVYFVLFLLSVEKHFCYSLCLGGLYVLSVSDGYCNIYNFISFVTTKSKLMTQIDVVFHALQNYVLLIFLSNFFS